MDRKRQPLDILQLIAIAVALIAALLRACVEDSGTGVAEPDAERIFEPFETTRASGMGMGLAISRAVVEAHGGRLWVESGSAGRFCFTLPVEAARG
jgi:signal transduction histidine kinase